METTLLEAEASRTIGALFKKRSETNSKILRCFTLQGHWCTIERDGKEPEEFRLWSVGGRSLSITLNNEKHYSSVQNVAGDEEMVLQSYLEPLVMEMIIVSFANNRSTILFEPEWGMADLQVVGTMRLFGSEFEGECPILDCNQTKFSPINALLDCQNRLNAYIGDRTDDDQEHIPLNSCHIIGVFNEGNSYYPICKKETKQDKDSYTHFWLDVVDEMKASVSSFVSPSGRMDLRWSCGMKDIPIKFYLELIERVMLDAISRQVSFIETSYGGEEGRGPLPENLVRALKMYGFRAIRIPNPKTMFFELDL